MGIAIPILLFCIALFGITQAAIAVNLYRTTGKTQDGGYKFSIFILVGFIILLIASGIFIYLPFHKGGDPNGNANANANAAPANAPAPAIVQE